MQQTSRKQFDPYGHVNWQKAQKVLHKPLPHDEKVHRSFSTRDILLTLAQVGLEAVIDVLEIKRRLANNLHPGIIDPEYETWRTTQSIRQLEKRRCVRTTKDAQGRTTIVITKHGMYRALTYNLDTLTLKKPGRWDKKWRVVMFDIPVKYGRIRDIFRMRLRQLGLCLLQESVYVSPYPCFQEVEFLRELYGVAFTVRYLLVDRIEDDGHLLSHFHLRNSIDRNKKFTHIVHVRKMSGRGTTREA